MQHSERTGLMSIGLKLSSSVPSVRQIMSLQAGGQQMA